MTRPAASKVVLQTSALCTRCRRETQFPSSRHCAGLAGVGNQSKHPRFEDEIGFTLFERSHTGVRLTEAGKHYLRDVRAVLRYLDRDTAEAQSIASGQQGRLRLAVSEDVMTLTLARPHGTPGALAKGER
jgi:hypothetical protein